MTGIGTGDPKPATSVARETVRRKIAAATLLAVIFGTVRNVFERNLPSAVESDIRRQLVRMCVSYLATAKNPGP